MTFDLQLVPVTKEHGVDVVHKVGRGEQDVGVGQPMSAVEMKLFSPLIDYFVVTQSENVPVKCFKMKNDLSSAQDVG